MSVTNRLADLSAKKITRLLKTTGLVLDIGPFSARIKSPVKALTVHLKDLYAGYPVKTQPYLLPHQMIEIDAPYRLRRYFRPQIIARTLTDMPFVPLPPDAAGLAFEMGLNFSVATGHFGHVILHAGVVDYKGCGIVMSAASGKGKTTLTAALMAQGARLFSDEFALVDPETANLVPYPRPLSLKEESIAIVRSMFTKASLSSGFSSSVVKAPKGKVAYAAPRQNDIDRMNEASAAGLLLFPDYDPDKRPFAARLEKPEVLMRLIAASPNYQIIGKKGFLAISQLVERCQAFHIGYGSTQEAVSFVDDLIKTL